MVVEALLDCFLFYLGNELILIHIRKLCRSSACLVRIAGPCPAEPFQLVPAQLGLTPAGSYQLCTRHRNAACSQQHQHDLPALHTETRHHVAEDDEQRTSRYELSEVSGIVQRANEDADEDQQERLDGSDP
jgi:hypothetical protein